MARATKSLFFSGTFKETGHLEQSLHGMEPFTIALVQLEKYRQKERREKRDLVEVAKGLV